MTETSTDFLNTVPEDLKSVFGTLNKKVQDCSSISEAYKEKHEEVEKLYLNYYLLAQIQKASTGGLNTDGIETALKKMIDSMEKNLTKEQVGELKKEQEGIMHIVENWKDTQLQNELSQPQFEMINDAIGDLVKNKNVKEGEIKSNLQEILMRL